METYITMCKLDSQGEFAVWLRKLKPGRCINLEGWDGEGDGREAQKEGIYVYLWLIHVEVWQKTTKFCKAVILPLKNNCFFKRRKPGLPWWLSGKESPFQYRGHEFDPWSKKTPHAAEKLSLCATTIAPVS